MSDVKGLIRRIHGTKPNPDFDKYPLSGRRWVKNLVLLVLFCACWSSLKATLGLQRNRSTRESLSLVNWTSLAVPKVDKDTPVKHPLSRVPVPSSVVSAFAALKANPLVIEVGGLVLFQLVGLPLCSKLIEVARRIHWVPSILARLQRWIRVGRLANLDKILEKFPTRTVHALQKSVRSLTKSYKTMVRLFRKRSRLCIASEVTNLIPTPEDE